MEVADIFERIKLIPHPKSVDHLKRVKIDMDNALGTRVGDLRVLAKEIGTNHDLALKLWDTKNRECMMLACLIDEPKRITNEQIEAWVLDCVNWELCDCLMCNAFEKTQMTYQKAIEWADRKEEFVKRAAFVLMARYGLKNRKITEVQIASFWELIIRNAVDSRNMVMKAVNWALRQLGKKNSNFNQKAIKVAEEIQKLDSPAAKWIAKDAIRELKNKHIQSRFGEK